MSACRVSTVSPREEGFVRTSAWELCPCPCLVWSVRVWCGVCVYLYVSTNASISRSANPLASGPAGTHAGERSNLVVRSKLRIDLRIAKLLAPRLRTLTHTHMSTHTDTYVHLSIGGI